jgi:hypothetical protein
MNLHDVQIGIGSRTMEWVGLVARTVELYTRLSSEILKGSYYLGDLGVYCRIILKCVHEE